MRKKVFTACLICLLLLGHGASWACRVCRPKVQAQIHTAEYSANLVVLLLPVGILLVLGLGLFFAPTLQKRFTVSSAHD